MSHHPTPAFSFKSALGLIALLVCLAPLPSLAQTPVVTRTDSGLSVTSAEERAAEKKRLKAQAKAEKKAKAQVKRELEAQDVAEAKARRAQERLALKQHAEDAVKIAKPSIEPSRAELKNQASQMAAGIVAAEAALSPDELAIAKKVHTGILPCELGVTVTIESDPAMPGYFTMSGKNFRYRMHPVVSLTGAIRLEDRQAGAVWLQLANKSMLMNQKAGRRMADECMSPAQASHAQHMKMNPTRGLLDVDVAASSSAPEAKRSAKPSRSTP
jgi:hypothetical protein